MTRTAFILALCLATPASAATVQLDVGDLGVEWVEGVGFRPIDGVQVYGSKFDCPRVGLSWKSTATDRVMRDVRCDEPLSARCCHSVQRPSRADGGCYPEGCRGDSIAPSAAKWCSEGRKVPTATGHLFPTKLPALDPHPHIPPVPLPASIWLLALALIGLIWRTKK